MNKVEEMTELIREYAVEMTIASLAEAIKDGLRPKQVEILIENL